MKRAILDPQKNQPTNRKVQWYIWGFGSLLALVGIGFVAGGIYDARVVDPILKKVRAEMQAQRIESGAQKQLAQIPTYKIVSAQDVSFYKTKRIAIKAVLPEHYSEEAVNAAARVIVNNVIKKQSVNAISVLFYGPNSDTRGIYDVASVDWAPHGQWGDASMVRTGDYRTFRYKISYIPPTQR